VRCTERSGRLTRLPLHAMLMRSDSVTALNP
jgi:hypothetical protein